MSSLSGVPVEPHPPSRKYDELGQFIALAAAVAGDTPAGGPGDALEDVVLHDTVGQAVHGRPVTAGKPARDLLGLRHSRWEPRFSSSTRPTSGRMLTQYRGTGHTLRGKWVLKGKSALADPTSASWAEKASYHSAVCLETG